MIYKWSKGTLVGKGEVLDIGQAYLRSEYDPDVRKTCSKMKRGKKKRGPGLLEYDKDLEAQHCRIIEKIGVEMIDYRKKLKIGEEWLAEGDLTHEPM